MSEATTDHREQLAQRRAATRQAMAERVATEAWEAIKAILGRADRPVRSQAVLLRLAADDPVMSSIPRQPLRDAWNAAIVRGDLLFCRWSEDKRGHTGFILSTDLERFQKLLRFALLDPSDWQKPANYGADVTN